MSNESTPLFIYTLSPMDDFSHTIPPVTWIQSYAATNDDKGYYHDRQISVPEALNPHYIPDIFGRLDQLEEWSVLHYPTFLSPINFLRYRCRQLSEHGSLWDGDGIIGINGFPSIVAYSVVPTIFIKQESNGVTFFSYPLRSAYIKI